MSAVHIVNDAHLPFPGRTVWGRTAGPVAYVGDVIPATGSVQGVACLLDERESREVAFAWEKLRGRGWPRQDEFQELEENAAEQLMRIAELEAELELLRPIAVAISDARSLRRASDDADLRERSEAMGMQNVEIVHSGSVSYPVEKTCSETKVDGTPCTARALPGRDVCVAHTKTREAVA